MTILLYILAAIAILRVVNYIIFLVVYAAANQSLKSACPKEGDVLR